MRGWIKLHRKLLNSRVFSNEGLLRVWIYCLCRANHEVNYVPIATGKGNTEVRVGKGEFIFGRNSVASDLNMNPSTLYKRMQKLKEIGNINIQSNSHYSVVSICNWGTYQDDDIAKEQPKEQASNNQVTGKEQASNTDKNVNNVNNDKNKTHSVSTNGTDFPDSCKYINEARELANLLLERIKQFDPTHKYHRNPPSLNSWILDIERAMRLDGRDYDHLEWVINFLFTQNHDIANFWAPNIQSGSSLREKFDTIKQQLLRRKGNEQSKRENISNGIARVEELDWD